MSIKTTTRDPWAGIRDQPNVFVNTSPRTRADISIPTTAGIRVGWSLFWRSVWWTIRRRRSIDFWIES